MLNRLTASDTAAVATVQRVNCPCMQPASGGLRLASVPNSTLP